MAALAFEIKAIWHWWLTTLAGMLPLDLPVRVDVGPDGLLRLQRGGAGLVWDGMAPLPAHLRAPARLVLPSVWGLVRDISLPAAAGRHLYAVARFEIDRVTPFEPDAVTYAVRPLSGGGDAGQGLRARLLVVPNRHIQPHLERLRAAGAVVARVELAGEAMPLPVAGLHRPSWSGGWAWLAVLLAILLVAASAQQHYGALNNAAQADLTALRQQAIHLADTREGEAQRLMALAKALPTVWPPSLVAVLDDLSRRIPDSAHVQRLALDGAQLQLDGFAASAAALVPVLEQSPLIETVGFLAPTLRDDRSGAERFQFTIRLTGGAP